MSPPPLRVVPSVRIDPTERRFRTRLSAIRAGPDRWSSKERPSRASTTQGPVRGAGADLGRYRVVLVWAPPTSGACRAAARGRVHPPRGPVGAPHGFGYAATDHLIAAGKRMTPIVKPGEVGPPPSAVPRLLLPDPSRTFTRRAARLRQLAQGHPLADYLHFLAAIAEEQQAALDRFPAVPVPDDRHTALCREHGLPPLAFSSWPRATAWHWGRARILDAAAAWEPLPDAARTAIQRLKASSRTDIEDLASRVLAAEYGGLDPAAVPFVAAALQVYWVHLTTALGMDAYPHGAPANLCPVCGSRPVASIVHSGGDTHGLRYLACSLCATRWHLVRTKCVNCDSAKGLAYYTADATGDASAPTVGRSERDAQSVSASGTVSGEPADGTLLSDLAPAGRGMKRGHRAAVQAEACDECRSYLKIGHMESDPAVEPVADDLATLALDLMMADAGYERFGVDPLLVVGSDERIR